LVADLGAGRADERSGYSDTQLHLILTHGPWPAPWTPDPSNRISGKPDAVELGRRLFFDARMSPSGRISCSSCHRPERGWTDGRPRGIGLEPGDRNTPTLYDVRLYRRFGWGGGVDSLWAQSIRPLIDPKEMGSSATHVRSHLAADQDLARAYEAVFGRRAQDADAELVLVDAAKALAAYLETIVSGPTAFDRFRDALAASDTAAAARYPVAAQRGLAIFEGKGQCGGCHAGPAFTDGRTHPMTGAGGERAARPTETLLSTRYSLSGPFNDDPSGPSGDGSHLGAGIRVPTLRNLTRSAPYMHDGTLTTLEDAVRRHPGGAPTLDDQEIADLVAFLQTLSE
jgi:cytochrome c peroxidase